MKYTKIVGLVVLILLLVTVTHLYADKPYRRGTTTANFLEIGFSGQGNAMGDAVVASVNDLSSIYWNPAGLGLMRQSGIQFMVQPWIANINTSFASAGLVIPGLGTVAIGLIQVDYGREEVTTMLMQEGTGEHFSANDIALSLGFGRKLTQWFAFGASVKMVHSKIWHTSGSAFALDLGSLVQTGFFSPTGRNEDGLTIGMSISNYGTRMQYSGMDLMHPIDPNPDTRGEYENVEGQYGTQGWELPLIFRIGAAIHPIVANNHRLTLEANALHPNNNAESVNVGGEYALIMPSFGTFFLRGGYKGLLLDRSEFGPTFGGGFIMRLPRMNTALQIDYAYRGVGILGTAHSYTFSIHF
ncbi:PorV/PorQ family protein [candidate division KSB1 bacterium]|nr:PorV/PorQ family protein [candidate division KSB1 bacterium]